MKAQMCMFRKIHYRNHEQGIHSGYPYQHVNTFVKMKFCENGYVIDQKILFDTYTLGQDKYMSLSLG